MTSSKNGSAKKALPARNKQVLRIAISKTTKRMTLMDSGCTSATEVMGLVKLGNSKALAAMLQSDSPPLEELNTPDKNGRTCLSYAVSNGDSTMVELLLATDIPDSNIADTDGNTPLIYAVSLGNSAITEKLLKYDTTNIDQANNSGFTALIKAAIHDHHSCMETLIKAGADIDVIDHVRELNALQWAELCASKTCIKTLKKHKLQPVKKSNSQRKPCKDRSEHMSPLRKIKDSLTGLNHKHKEHRGMESVVACVTVPTIPLMLANANPPPNIQQLLIEPSLLTQDNGKHTSTSKKSTHHAIVAPRIEITSDTGECIIPTKHFFATPPHKHCK